MASSCTSACGRSSRMLRARARVAADEQSMHGVGGWRWVRAAPVLLLAPPSAPGVRSARGCTESPPPVLRVPTTHTHTHTHTHLGVSASMGMLRNSAASGASAQSGRLRVEGRARLRVTPSWALWPGARSGQHAGRGGNSACGLHARAGHMRAHSAGDAAQRQRQRKHERTCRNAATLVGTSAAASCRSSTRLRCWPVGLSTPCVVA
jgi:hypothetical protein